MSQQQETVVVVGLGYVGLPLAVAFGKCMPTIGFDIHREKVEALRTGSDPMGELSDEEMAAAEQLTFSNDPTDIAKGDYVVVAVPTPVDPANAPDFGPLRGASLTVGKHVRSGAIVIFESTVYPGATEEICLPIIERESGMKAGRDFWLGYSPERINPGDKVHTLATIVKVVSGQDQATLERVATLYERVVDAGVHRAPSIRVAEAAKVIENSQRDLNIALMNELAVIFKRLKIDTVDVLEAAGTKWNFLPFRPGLVGGHCIGVDPYYLTYKAEMVGYRAEVILAGRRLNDAMGDFVAAAAIKRMAKTGAPIKDAHVLVMGFTFKENCADFRNTRVIDVVEGLREYGARPVIWDPLVDPSEARHEYGVEVLNDFAEVPGGIHAIIAAVSHQAFLDFDLAKLAAKTRPNTSFLDVKSAFDREAVAAHGFNLWRL